MVIKKKRPGREKATRKTIRRKPVKKQARGGKVAATTPKKGRGFSQLERDILRAKGVGEAQLRLLEQKNVRCKEDLRIVGDALTLTELCGLDKEVAERVMAWASATPTAGGTVVVESGDVVNCVACGRRQPKDFKSGDLCVFCGKQAEPVFACYWCGASGPGKFCRACGATFVPAGELELAILLKRDGLSKEEIPSRLAAMSPAEKEILWGRVRARR